MSRQDKFEALLGPIRPQLAELLAEELVDYFQSLQGLEIPLQVAKEAVLKRWTCLGGESPISVTDTVCRGDFLNGLVEVVLGGDWFWPMYGSDSEYSKEFWKEFEEKGKALGVSFTEEAKEV